MSTVPLPDLVFQSIQLGPDSLPPLLGNRFIFWNPTPMEVTLNQDIGISPVRDVPPSPHKPPSRSHPSIAVHNQDQNELYLPLKLCCSYFYIHS